jgi:phage baseplate assembly protein W
MELWSDINNRLQILPSGDIKVDRNLDAVARSIENILLTRVGERVMRPSFGTRLEYLLHEPISPAIAHQIGLEVLSALREWEDRIMVDKIDVVANHKLGGYQVAVHAVLRELNIPLVWSKVLTL